MFFLPDGSNIKELGGELEGLLYTNSDYSEDIS